MKKYIAKLVIASAFIGSVTLGASAVSAQSYGMAGCGLGSLIIKDNNIMQIFAATSNNPYTPLQTSAITTGTSNCTPGGQAYNEKRQQIFVHVNYEALEHEMAVGTGTRLSAFAGLFGCSSESFSTAARKEYGTIFASNNPDTVLAAVRSMIAKDAQLSNSCKI